MIDIYFDNSRKEASAFGLTQWDKGQKLKIIWDEMPESIQVHFASRGSSEAIVTTAEISGNEAVTEIPDVLLQQCEDIFLWIYVTEGSTVGESVKKGVLYVRPRAKPHTAIEDLEKTQQEILEDILRDIDENIRYIKENGADAEYIPEYVKTQAQDIVKSVISAGNENTLTFIAASDAHLKTGDHNSTGAVNHMAQAMKIIAQSCPVDFIAYLGDMTSGGEEKAMGDAVNEIISVNSAITSAGTDIPVFRCTGAEDCINKAYFRNGSFIDASMLYNLIGKWNKDSEYPDIEKARGYFYRDLEKEKLRVICLNTSEIYSKQLMPSSETALMSGSQLNWLCESLDLSSKTDSNSWKIILLGHHPLDMIGKFTVALEILKAYTKGESLDMLTSAGERVAYNFSGKNSATILGQFNGYLHNYRVAYVTEKNIPLITIPNAGFYDSNYYADSSYTNEENNFYSDDVTYEKTASGEDDTAFCVVVVDKQTGKINAFHYGAGKDRVIDGTGSSDEGGSGDNTGENEGGTGSGTGGNTPDDDEITEPLYNNLVSYSLDENNNTYNGTGYMDDYRLNSENAYTYKGNYVHTGYFSASKNDTIRVAGADFDGTTGNYIIIFNAEKQVIWVGSLTGETDDDTGFRYTTTGILEFLGSRITEVSLADMAYFRISTIGTGEELIVTINEPIDDSEIAEGDIGGGVTAYTNILQYATDKYGNAFAQLGYRDGSYIGADGYTKSKTGRVVTGYLEADMQAVIRTKGITYDGTDGCYMCLFDSDFKLFKSVLLTGDNDNLNGISYDGMVMKFTPADATADLSKLAYFRLSGIGTGTKLIITYCEEID